MLPGSSIQTCRSAPWRLKVQTNAAARLFAAMHWCRLLPNHPEVPLCASRCIRLYSGALAGAGFDVVEQKDYPHDIIDDATAESGRARRTAKPQALSGQ
ncbi:hypothetical protein ACU4GD_34190 [Cupriavidus basilensis]